MPGPYFITQAELDELRAIQIQSIVEIGGFGTIRRPTVSPDGVGGFTNTYTVQNNVPMRLWISSGPNGTSEETRFWGNQEKAQSDAFVVLAWNADIQIQDQIIYDNREWEVVGLQITDTFRTAIRVRVEAMRNVSN